MQLHGIHHVTAVTAKVKNNLDFYTKVLGLRLVKKSVNQDDVSAYHMFYADKVGTPGTDMTFFDSSQIDENTRGTDSIVNTMFRVNGRAALDYWVERLDAQKISHGDVTTVAERTLLRFEDPEGQRLTLIDDGGVPFEGKAWDGANIPAEHTIRGFYGIMLSIPKLSMIEPILVQVLGFEKKGRYPSLDTPDENVFVYAMDGGGPSKEVHVVEQPQQGRARLGFGGVHHVAFRVKDNEEQDDWSQQLAHAGIGTSGVVDRFYFRSVYFRISGGILFEIATDGPGFAADESLETLGERLALPPFLEPHRAEIEAGLEPI